MAISLGESSVWGDFIRDIDVRRGSLQLVGHAVNADKRRNLVAVGICDFHYTAEVAGILSISLSSLVNFTPQNS